MEVKRGSQLKVLPSIGSPAAELGVESFVHLFLKWAATMPTRLSNRAALYLRSSKDRSDVSIDAQRRELKALASQRGLNVVAEYADVVISGTEENRPGLTRLIADMRRRGRG
jgi:hypothetical protein